jgi:hypothetical protein
MAITIDTESQKCRQERTADPRGHEPENSGRRLRLFGQVYDTDQEELLGALNYLRCTGAQIIDGDVGWRIDRGVAVMAHVDRRTMHMLQMRPCAALVC